MPGPDRDPSDERPILVERSHDETTPASIAVVYAISAALDTDPIECTTEHGFTLYDHVDPEALDALMDENRQDAGVTVELSLNEHLLRVSDRGCVRVLGPTDSEGESNG
ncbi:HalOD1 output domain-containing protein [Natrinema sp. LN54]|uniref:HalOD1 output domain-containing protein n=1 Tax=Natrinema sp. LN54 TaxID=3458705 RepID=UPI004035FB34